ncbi:hypothetical protein DFH08DRAFT_946283 [Mycena albidolilacea]|uniref:Uncharacterized protein n=1 Tax=Mycena albidolilacea TaxID=1033008 RepID=A0AAD7E7I0_9AGAR|nr:hypothetical protein DFH08DRAFT_946283 [Mycena albidolilacea]
MSAPPRSAQKPLLLPGLAPHLFQSRAPAHLQPQRKMRVKDSSAGPVMDHPRTPSDDSTVAVPTREEIRAALVVELQELRQRVQALEEQLHTALEKQLHAGGTYIPQAVRAGIDTISQRVRDAGDSFLRSLILWGFSIL